MSNTTETTIASGTFLLGPSDPAHVFIPEQFDEEARMLAQSVEDFVTERVLPLWEAIDAQQEGLLPGLVRETGELGVFAVDVPEALGGLGAAKTTAILISEKIGMGGSYAPAVAVQTGIGGLPILYFGTDEQRAKYVEKILSGETITAYGLTEAGSGSDALGARTTAVLDEAKGVYVLNGSKQFITNAGFADLFIVFAKVDGDKFTAFIVEKGAPGFTVGPEEHKLGLKGSSTCALSFDDTPVPAENVLGEIGKGHKIAFNVLNIGRLKLSPLVLGGAKISLGEGAKYAKERHQFGKPLAAFPLIQQKLAAACARTYCHETNVYRAAHDIDRYIEASSAPDKASATVAALHELSVECSINKVYASESIDFVVDEMLQLHGGYGFIAEYNAERHYRDARINRIWEGTSEINRMIITGTLLEKTMKGELPLLPAIKRITDELMSRSGSREAPEGDFGAELAAVELARKQTLFAAGVAAQKHMQNLQEEQEVLSWLADMIIQTYTMESAVLRAMNAAARVDEKGTIARRAAARLAIETGMPMVEAAAKQVLAASAQGEELRSMLSIHRKLTRREPFEVRAEGRILAQAVLDAEGYPF
ncbi:MAG TPA: acyl-CoA dehydrogenase family protein [Longimicrobiales bacterium]|nr:acyl-CoA dehydrogenase family protein [Longimicrobiales bacterium]